MIDDPKCVVCGYRKGEALKNRCCRRCAILTAAEGTREKFGLPKPKPSRRKTASSFAAAWNKAIAEGVSVSSIATSMGMSWQTLRNRASEVRKMGFTLASSRTVQDRRLVAQAPIEVARNGRNGHGEGKMGVSRCKCQPCLDRRAQTRREWKQANPQRLVQYKENQNAKERAKRARLRKLREARER